MAKKTIKIIIPKEELIKAHKLRAYETFSPSHVHKDKTKYDRKRSKIRIKNY